MVKDSSKDLKSSLQIKEFTPVNFNSFLSPHGGASKNSGMHCIRAFKNILNTTLVIKWLNSFLSPFGGASKNSGVHCTGSCKNILNTALLIRWFFLSHTHAQKRCLLLKKKEGDM